MFDLSKDLPVPVTEAPVEEVAGGKRKRDGSAGVKMPVGYAEMGESGAGDKILLGQSRGMVATPGKGAAVVSEDEDDEDGMLKLTRGNRTDDEQDDDENDDKGGTQGNKVSKRGQRHKPFWRTNRYRNLMALLPIGGKEVFTGRRWGDRMEAMEMVVVERPNWDIEMPPRFYQGGGSGFGTVM